MVNYKIKTDKYGNQLIEYEVLRGDTFSLSISLTSAGENVSRETISKVVYKQSGEDYVELYRTEFEFDEYTNKYVAIIPSEVTAGFESGVSYIYEIEITFLDGSVLTPTQSKIKYKDEIVKGVKE